MTPVTVSANTNHTAVTRLAGFSFRETAGGAAVLRVRKGAVDGDLVFTLSFEANESLLLILGDNQLVGTEDGAYVQVVSGTVEGVLFEAD